MPRCTSGLLDHRGGTQRGEEEAGSETGEGQKSTRTCPGESHPAATTRSKEEEGYEEGYEEGDKKEGHPTTGPETDDASRNTDAVDGPLEGELVPN